MGFSDPIFLFVSAANVSQCPMVFIDSQASSRNSGLVPAKSCDVLSSAVPTPLITRAIATLAPRRCASRRIASACSRSFLKTPAMVSSKRIKGCFSMAESPLVTRETRSLQRISSIA